MYGEPRGKFLHVGYSKRNGRDFSTIFTLIHHKSFENSPQKIDHQLMCKLTKLTFQHYLPKIMNSPQHDIIFSQNPITAHHLQSSPKGKNGSSFCGNKKQEREGK